MSCKELTRADRRIVASHLRHMPRLLSAYSFAQFFIWKNLYRVEWEKIDGALCIFFHDPIGSFMNCEPLARHVEPSSVHAAFSAMDACNRNKAYSRIENVEQEHIAFYRSLGYEAVPKYGDYVYERVRLAQLRGDPYKSKRACCNNFLKTYAGRYLPYTSRFRQECLDLYDVWAGSRAATADDRIYAGMLNDSRTCLEAALAAPSAIGLTGRVIVVDKRVKAFTFGYELKSDTFCVLFEIADLSLKGISQYIFRQLCMEMTRYRYINAMDDSGLIRLGILKRSYRPAAIVPSYIIQRRHE
jgi:uncharacterized protein